MSQSNLFIFAIGGTGARVIKSLMFLLGSGVNIKANKVIPILIDPDSSNGDLERTYSIIKNYYDIHKEISSSGVSFFKTDIESLGSLAKNDSGIGGYRLTIKEVGDKLFKNFIHHGTLDKENKDFMNLLFSDENLNASMDIGFKGNPNIGSVVLNQLFTDKDTAISTFASNFKEGDRIFIISSIFGGTGAAGFPLVLKSLRNINLDVPNSGFIKSAKIGALSVLPYFGVEQSEDNVINKSSFISKTRAALRYYKRSVNDQLDALYYIGDTETEDYKNHPGASAQKNKAHFVELAGALSIINFMEIEDTAFDTTEIFKEFGVNTIDGKIYFNSLDKSSTQVILKKHLTKLYLMKRYLDVHISIARKQQPWTKRGKIKLDDSIDISELQSFLGFYEEWLKELDNNSISFSPFALSRPDNIKDLINGQSASPSSFKGSDHFVKFDRLLNAQERKVKNNNMYSKFLELFDKSTEHLYEKIYKN